MAKGEHTDSSQALLESFDPFFVLNDGNLKLKHPQLVINNNAIIYN